MLAYYFTEDSRLGIELPSLTMDWEDYPNHTREVILLKWESIRGKIPDRIKALEVDIMHKIDMLSQEENFETSCQLNSDIAELASVINDLWIWYRSNSEITEISHQ